MIPQPTVTVSLVNVKSQQSWYGKFSILSLMDNSVLALLSKLHKFDESLLAIVTRHQESFNSLLDFSLKEIKGTVLLGTTNPNKVTDINMQLFQNVTEPPYNVELELITSATLGIVDDIPETGNTLEQNAIQKALEVASRTNFKYPVISDDSGIFVASLKGRPGVDTKYYASTYTEARKKLLYELSTYKQRDQRHAFYKTTSVFYDPISYLGPYVIAISGMINGFMSSTEHIGTTDKSSKQWGYDPIFVPFEGDGRTLGQMSNTERLMFSSRGRVFRAMRKIIYAHLRATKVNTNE